MYIIAKDILRILYILLFLAFISGLFSVSAGANNMMHVKQIIDAIMKNKFGNIKYLQSSGVPIKNIMDVIQQYILLEA